MNRSVQEVRASDRPTGLIDTLQAGFNAVNRNVWLLIIPIAIDLFLWWGPQPAAGPVLERWLAQPPPAQVSIGLGPNFEQNRRASVEQLRRGEGAAGFNLLAFLILPGFGVNGVASIVLGLTLAALFYGLLAQGVRSGRASPTSFLVDFAQLAVWVIALFVMVVAVVAFAGGPLIALYVATQAMGPQSAAAVVASVLAAILVGVALWTFVYLFFTPSAIYVSKVPPLVAIQNSIRVVRYNFWSAIGLMLLMFLISAGLSVLWQQLAASVRTAGVPMAIAGHIYISAGLAAAGMTYYKERFERLRPAS